MEKTFRPCFIHNKHNGEKKQYVGIEYMKLQGIYGYLCVDNDEVKFIYADERGVVMDVLDFFDVIYEDLKIF
jgi:hypothetical protein